MMIITLFLISRLLHSFSKLTNLFLIFFKFACNFKILYLVTLIEFENFNKNLTRILMIFNNYD